MKHVGITGTREGPTPAQRDFLEEFFKLRVGTITLHHGCCVGVDEEAHSIAYRLGIPIVGYPPVKDDYKMVICPEEFVELKREAPYLNRDRDIVDAVDYLVVVPKTPYIKLIGGTWYTYQYAKQAHFKKTRIIAWPNGTAMHEFIVEA